MKADLYTQKGEKKGTVNLSKDIFEIEASEGLLHEAIVRHLANKRRALSCVKTRSDVSGGGKKPWRQKGTGRARQGTIRAPHWRGGGAVFAPTGVENFSKAMPKKMRRKALFGALNVKAKAKDILVLEEFKTKKPSTKEMAKLLEKLNLERNVLLVLNEKDFITEKSAANLPNVEVLLANYINVYDLLKANKVLFMNDALQALESIFTSKK